MPARSSTGYYGFKVIGALKVISALIALAAGMGATSFLAHDPGPKLESAVTHLGLDPQNQIIHAVISTLTGIDQTHLRAIEIGTFFYALLHLIEGTGLTLRTGLGRLSRRGRHQLACPLRDLRTRQEVDLPESLAFRTQHRHRHLFDSHPQKRAPRAKRITLFDPAFTQFGSM